jgi:hypothetical protein
MENQVDLSERVVDALDLIAEELERLRLLKEYELGAHVKHSPDPYVVPDDATEE